MVSDYLDETRTTRGSALGHRVQLVRPWFKTSSPNIVLTPTLPMSLISTGAQPTEMPKLTEKVRGYGCQRRSQLFVYIRCAEPSQVRARGTERPAAQIHKNLGRVTASRYGVNMIFMGFGYVMVCLRWSLRACAARLRLDAEPGVSNGGEC